MMLNPFGKPCEELKGSEYLGFDVETTELDPYRGAATAGLGSLANTFQLV